MSENPISPRPKPSSGDNNYIHRIFVNVISNAIKFTPDGEVTITTSNEKIEFNNWLIVKISDTGIGIDKHNLSLIFEPFCRIECSEIKKYRGIGLGLSSVKYMLNQIGGWITVDSILGKGSIFTVYLPTVS